MDIAQYLLTVSMIIAAQAPLRQLHGSPREDARMESAFVLSGGQQVLGATSH
jgi:hypothetical protein